MRSLDRRCGAKFPCFRSLQFASWLRTPLSIRISISPALRQWWRSFQIAWKSPIQVCRWSRPTGFLTARLVIGSPIYFGTATGETRSFIERLLFPYLTYTVPYGTPFPRKIKVGFIYTMNVSEERSREFGYEQIFNTNERYVNMLLGAAETLCAFDTCQVDDYSKVVIESFDPIAPFRAWHIQPGTDACHETR